MVSIDYNKRRSEDQFVIKPTHIPGRAEMHINKILGWVAIGLSFIIIGFLLGVTAQAQIWAEPTRETCKSQESRQDSRVDANCRVTGN